MGEEEGGKFMVLTSGAIFGDNNGGCTEGGIHVSRLGEDERVTIGTDEGSGLGLGMLEGGEVKGAFEDEG